jgi:predicted NAD/FAD-binding protein
MKIAIVGSGIAGNVIAHRLHGEHEIVVFEAGSHVGGHSHTHVVEHEGRQVAVDTGFIVFNRRNYPEFSQLLDALGVVTQSSQMSFSVQCERTGLEYNGTTLNSLFAQRRNLARPAFWRMVAEILRFNREAPALLDDPDATLTLGEYLDAGRYSPQFVNHYVLPMGAAIWSSGTDSLRDFPAKFFIRFFHNHGMLTVNERPQWYTVYGGSRRYVERLTAQYRDRIRLDTPVTSVKRTAAGVMVHAAGCDPERYDRVFLACHSDQALRLLSDATGPEREVLGAIRYSRNEVLLHTDTAVLPKRRLAWAAWNSRLCASDRDRVAVTYNMNLLQGLQTRTPLLVTLNMTDRVHPERILRRLVYEHPVFSREAVAAQARHAEIDGANRIYFAGAYWRNGFHEDGVVSALQALQHFERDAHAQRPIHRTA